MLCRKAYVNETSIFKSSEFCLEPNIFFIRYLRMHACSHLSSRRLFSKITEPDLNIERVERILESYANPRLRLGFV